MDTKYSIPNISAIKNGEEHNINALEVWKRYFQNQECIKTVTDKDIIRGIVEKGFSLPETDSKVAFIVMFPRSFLHLNDFLSNLKSSSAVAVFLEDGNAVVKINDDQQMATYLGAWQEIINRTTGKTSLQLIPELVTVNIDDLEKIKSNNQLFRERLQKWVNGFNQLPGVKADFYEDEVPDRLLEIVIQTSHPSLNLDTIEIWELCATDTADATYSDGHMGDVYENWRKDIIEGKEKLTWQKFYDNVVELSKKYTTVPEFKSKEN